MNSSIPLTFSNYPCAPADYKQRMQVYLANLRKLTDEERQKYPGQWIAIRWDGLEILSADPDLVHLREGLRSSGIDPEEAIYDYIHGPEEILIEHGSEIEIISNDASKG